MSVFERVGVLEPESEDTIHAGVSYDNYSGKREYRHPYIPAEYIQRDTKYYPMTRNDAERWRFLFHCRTGRYG